ncbi:E3 ubiquitin-protein ligase CHFR-like [Amphibalanus amphitrite]|uniref:E3 ubiquitin-protein ligase CHFR-like n=1 Tax=Amphibalanus amphitrite TaxID=1232801 RepID=UPI001C91FD88|nr:E3 ubiquitin-protein ligase CHFR-like [Amphibalanus amphitrite]
MTYRGGRGDGPTVVARHNREPTAAVHGAWMGSGESVPTAPAGATVPDICPAYNSAAAYCTSDSCLSLHICQGFVIGNCLYGERCSRTHQLTTVHNQLVLKKGAKKAAAVECPEGATGGEEPPSAPQRAGAGAPVSLTCAVCHELFVRATTLGCTHTFCEGCVRDVQRQRQPCPLCRAPIATAVRSLVIDDTVAEWFDGQDEETRRARRQLEAERRRQT